MKFQVKRLLRPASNQNERPTISTTTLVLVAGLFGATLFWITMETTSMESLVRLQSSSPANLAHHHSYGLFHDVSNEEWLELRRQVKAKSWYANPAHPLDRVEENNGDWWNQNNMIPNFDCPGGLQKVGKAVKEGTKLMCYPHRLVHAPEKTDCLVYSVGCAGSFKFEDALYEMHERGCEIHVFDPANWERPNDVANKNIHYHAWGLISTYDNSKSVVWPKGRGGGFKTFPETLDLLGHRDRTIDVFKIDCEGCEWSSIKDWIHLGFRQILVETHGTPSPNGTPKQRWYQKSLDISKDYYDLFRDHGYALYGKELFGKAMELSFIKLHDDFWKDE